MSALINGKNYDWGNLEVAIFGLPLVGFTEINWDISRESVNNYGVGNEPVSYGNKNFTYSGDVSLFVDEIFPIAEASPEGNIMKIPPFTVSVLFSGDGVPAKIVKLKNVRFLKNPFSAKQNDSQIVVKVPFVFAGIETS